MEHKAPDADTGVHIGHLIQQKVREADLTVDEFARRINCNRQNVYSIFSRSAPDMTLLRRISLVLDYNFLAPLSDSLQRQMDERRARCEVS